MDEGKPTTPPTPRIPPVEPDLLGSAMFLFSEYLLRFTDEPPARDDGDLDDEDEDEDASPIDMHEVLDLFAEELGTSVPVTLNLYMRVTAVYRLLAASPTLARLAAADDDSGGVSESALVAFARLDVQVTRSDSGFVAEFDPRDVREALTHE